MTNQRAFAEQVLKTESELEEILDKAIDPEFSNYFDSYDLQTIAECIDALGEIGRDLKFDTRSTTAK